MTRGARAIGGSPVTSRRLSDGQVLSVIRRHRAQVAESIGLHRRNGSSTGIAIAMVRLDTLDRLLKDAAPEAGDGYGDRLDPEADQ